MVKEFVKEHSKEKVFVILFRCFGFGKRIWERGVGFFLKGYFRFNSLNFFIKNLCY